MRIYRHAYILIGLLAVLLLVAACGTTSSASPGSSATSASTGGTATSDSGGRYGGGSTPPAATATPTTAPTATPTPASSVVVKVGTATVKGKATTVLTNVQGFTLYYLTTDTSTTSTCTDGCAGTWPPLLLASGTPTSGSPLPGKLTVMTDANGHQLQYNGHFLYTFDGDSAPGQANGEGSGGVWFVVTP